MLMAKPSTVDIELDEFCDGHYRVLPTRPSAELGAAV